MTPTRAHFSPAAANLVDLQTAPFPVDNRRGIAADPTGDANVVDGRYTLRQRLGDGRTDHVFLSEARGMQVAVKLLAWHTTYGWADDAVDHAFEARCSALEQVRHPAMANLLEHGIDVDASRRYMVSELVRGESVRRHREALGRALDVAEAARLLRPIAEALAACADKGVGHGRVTADNVLVVSAHGELPTRLVGFGHPNMRSAQPVDDAFQPPAVRAYATDLPLTLERCDVFSLGALAYFLTAGRGGTGARLSVSQKFCCAPIEATDDPRWNGLIQLALDTERGMTARQFADALDAIAEQSDIWMGFDLTWFHQELMATTPIARAPAVSPEPTRTAFIAAGVMATYLPLAAAALLAVVALLPHGAFAAALGA